MDDDVNVNGLLECNEILVVDIEMPAGWNFIKFQFISFSSTQANSPSAKHVRKDSRHYYE